MVLFVLLTELFAASTQFVPIPTVIALVWYCNRQPWPAGHERLRTPPLTLFVRVAGPLGPAFTTLNAPWVKLKALPLSGLPTRLAK